MRGFFQAVNSNARTHLQLCWPSELLQTNGTRILERLALADEPTDAAESPTIAAPEGAAIAATKRPMEANLLATWQREREEAAMRPVPPAFDSTRRNFVAFLANLDLQHHAQRLREEQIESCLLYTSPSPRDS